ncbi:MAG: AbrB/MazE/SpoVT family DNA-binding domain-containing protein [Anaerolineaceae bacterium]|nr:AbrB/MazE/SpoVT family DNA-binding domain-containing protein [Anaerolineaceae bacterium]
MGRKENQRFYGSITVSERGQIVIPAEARRDLNIEVGDKLLVLGDIERGLVIAKATVLLGQLGESLNLMSMINEELQNPEGEE